MSHPLESLIQKYEPKTLNDFENALKELIQEIALSGLARAHFFDSAAFYGGTALRIFYGLPRFSEDLDFTLLQPKSTFSLQHYFSSILDMLQSFGFETTFDEVKKSQNTHIESAYLKANIKTHLLKLKSAKDIVKKVHSNQAMHVKFEVDTLPPLGFESEVKTLFPPITAAIRILKPSSLFSGKIHAALFRSWKQRVKGRDFYDILWFLGRNIPVKLSYLEQKIEYTKAYKRTQHLRAEDVISLLEQKLRSVNWEDARQDIIRFLNNPSEVSLWSEDFFLNAIQNLKFEP